MSKKSKSKKSKSNESKEAKKPQGKITPISDLPVEVVAKIIPYCSMQDLKAIRSTCSLFLQATDFVSELRSRQLFAMIYDGQVELLDSKFFFPNIQLIVRLKRLYRSTSFRESARKYRHDKVRYSHYFILCAIWNYLEPYEPVEATFEQLLDNIYDRVKSGDITYIQVFQFASTKLIRMATPKFKDDERFRLAINSGNISVAYEFLQRVFAESDGGLYHSKKPYHPVELADFVNLTFRRVPHYTIKMLFTCAMPKPDLQLCKMYTDKWDPDSKSANLSALMFDALRDRHINLDHWFHQIICWMFTATKVEAVRYLLSVPSVDPGRWNSFSLACLLVAQNYYTDKLYPSISEVLLDPRVDPIPQHRAVMNVKDKGPDLEVLVAFHRNPMVRHVDNKYRDYDLKMEIERLKAKLWGPSKASDSDSWLVD